ncbi:MAG: UDP-N-acetylmuramate dehydrogenase, partial [Myxococcaceae bacterium]
RHDKVPEGEELNVPKLIEALKAQGIAADGATDVPTLVERVASEAKPGDVLLVMSNGAFGGFIDKLLAALKARAGKGT